MAVAVMWATGTYLCLAWYWSQMARGVMPSALALVSVAVPYSSVPQMYTAFFPRWRHHLHRVHVVA